MIGAKIVDGFKAKYVSEIFGILQTPIAPETVTMPTYNEDSISSMRGVIEQGDDVVNDLVGSLMDAYEVIDELENLALDMFDQLPLEEQEQFIYIGTNQQKKAIIKKLLLVDHLANL